LRTLVQLFLDFLGLLKYQLWLYCFYNIKFGACMGWGWWELVGFSMGIGEPCGLGFSPQKSADLG